MDADSPTAVVTVERLVAGGDGLARLQGQPVFVPGAAPGDRLRIEVVARRARHAHARILEVLRPGPERVAPPCPVYGRCGGCQWQHLSYAGQLAAKREIVREALRRIGGMGEVAVGPVLPCAEPFRYRHKTAVPFTPAGWGFFARGSHAVVAWERCLIQHPLLDRVVAAVREIVADRRIPPYDERTRRGLLRHLVARCDVRGSQALAALVVNGPALPDEEGLAADLRAAVPELRGVVRNVNTAPGNAILGPRSHVISGRDGVTEEVDGLRFLVSAASFFQVNPVQAATLHRLAAERAGAGDLAWDLYAGVGAIALRLAPAFGHVIGIESAAAAVADASQNARDNGLGNAEFVAGRVEELLPRVGGRPDVAVLDPPRKGVEPEVPAALAARGVPRLVYVSCDPATMARDCRRLADAGYRLHEVQPLDMFPQTAHVECVAALTRAA